VRTMIGSAGPGGRDILAALGQRFGVGLARRTRRRLLRTYERLRDARRSPGHAFCGAVLAGSLGLSALAGGALLKLADAVLVTSGFGVGAIKIEGARETAELALLEALATDGRSLLLYDVGFARASVASLPWIETVSVRKLYPETLVMSVTERRAFALWQHDGRIDIIDADGRPITALDDPRFADLPLVVGSGANERASEIVAALGTAPLAGDAVAARVLVAGRRWDLKLKGGVTLRLPERGLPEALACFAALEAQAGLTARAVEAIDLRVPGRVAVRLLPEEAEARRKETAALLKQLAKGEAAL